MTAAVTTTPVARTRPSTTAANAATVAVATTTVGAKRKERPNARAQSEVVASSNAVERVNIGERRVRSAADRGVDGTYTRSDRLRPEELAQRAALAIQIAEEEGLTLIRSTRANPASSGFLGVQIQPGGTIPVSYTHLTLPTILLV